MTKVYPNVEAPMPIPPADHPCNGGKCVVLTVWKKSLLFNFHGYTVFDGHGNLVYRVDNYISGNKGEILLMDALGFPLLTIRRKRFSLRDTWLVLDGDAGDNVNVQLMMRKNVKLVQLHAKCLAHVSLSQRKSESSTYQIEGSYSQRRCAMYDEKRRCLVEIKPKEASVRGVGFGTDVFHLVINTTGGIDSAAAMAIVILLDQMFGSSKSLRFLTN